LHKESAIIAIHAKSLKIVKEYQLILSLKNRCTIISMVSIIVLLKDLYFKKRQ